MKTLIIIVSVALLAGCSGVRTVKGDMEPVRGGCRGLELRPSWFSTGLAVACWNESGDQTVATATPGTAVVEVPLRGLDAAATFGGMYVLGSKIAEAAGRIPTDFDITHDVSLPSASDFEGLRTVLD